MSQSLLQSEQTVIHTAEAETIQLSPDARVPTVRSAGQTDPGKVRPTNQDQFLIAEVTRTLFVKQSSLTEPRLNFGHEKGYLFVVADGVGGHAGGERASALAISSIEQFALQAVRWCYGLQGSADDRVLKAFQQAVGLADAAIVAEAEKYPELHGMGTTVTMAYCHQNNLFVAHAGDSRCYVLRGGHLDQVTHDHTMVQDMINLGLLKPEEAGKNKYRHVITNVVGGMDLGCKVELHKLQVEVGDILLLCSDGLTGMVSNDQITATLQAHEDPAAACKALVEQANAKGGRDNVTVIVARFEGNPS